MKQTGVLVMAYGTPSSREEVEPYYTKIRHGRPPTAEQLADLVMRYDAIGGISPLAERTAAQVAGIAAALEELVPGAFDVRFGSKYTEPSIEQTAASFVEDGFEKVIGLALTPHGASMSTGEYLGRAETALDGRAELIRIPSWYDTEGFDELLATRVVSALDSLSDDGNEPLVLFTAHSLPARILEQGDPYPDQLAESAHAITAKAGVQRYEVAWQSAGRTPEPWIGPDILEVIAGLPAREITTVVVCPVGFVSDHLEVLYDVDIDSARVAEANGVRLVRTASLNDDPTFMEILARRIMAADR